MLPGPLVSVYRQYKQDTDAIAAWLASTAVAHGYSQDLLRPGATQQKASGRLKGKARTEAKKDTTNTPTKARKEPTYRIPLADFIVLAEFIAAKKGVSIPLSFPATLDRLIRVRGGFGQLLADYGETLDRESDGKHNFFVGILERVQEILRHRFPLATAKPATTDATEHHFTNLFAGLTVYEPSEEFLNAPDVDRPQPAPGDAVTYEAQPLTTVWDAMFAVDAMVNDLNRLRSRIAWIWSNYLSGSRFDLVAAAIATNTAVDLARSIAEDVVPLTIDHGGPGEVLCLVFHLQGLKAGHSLEGLRTPNFDGDWNNEFYDASTSNFLLAYRLVEAFATDLRPGRVPLYKESMFETYNPQENRDEKSGYEKYIEDRDLLTSMFSEALSAVVGVPDYPVEDGFLQGMRELSQTSKIPFYLVFAAQIFLDIHHILREDADVAFKTFERRLKKLSHEIEIHLEFQKRLKTIHWPTNNDLLMISVQRNIAVTLNDPVYKVKATVHSTLGTSEPYRLERNLILKMSPVLSGLMLYRFSWKVRETSLAVVDSWGSVLYTAHLYNALRTQQLVSSWPDMDMVRSHVGDSNFFVGDPPTTMDECLKKFNLQTGVSLATWTKTRRESSKIGSKSGPRSINYERLVPVSRMFKDRYACKSGRVDWTAELVDEVISLSHYEAMGSEEEGNVRFSRIEDEAKLQEKKRKVMHGRKKDEKASSGALLPAEELIGLLTIALDNETLERDFPWFLMHRACWELLRALKSAAGPLLRARYRPSCLEREDGLPILAGWLIRAASSFDGRPDIEPMVKAAEAAKAFMSEHTGRQALDWLTANGVSVQSITEDELEAKRHE